MASTATDSLLQRAIVVAPIRRDAELTCQVLTRARIESVVCRDLDDLCRAIEGGAGVVIVAQEMLSPLFIASLEEVLDRQPPWSDLPIVVLTRSHEALDPILEQVAPLANVTFLERPVRMGTLLSAVRAALRARRRQIEIRDFSRRKDEFLAMLGHELRNPLGAIQNAVSVLQSDHSAERSKRSRQIIERQLRNLSRIVDDVLDVSRVTTGKIVLERQSVDIIQLVQRWMQVFGETDAVRDHVVTLVLPVEPLYVNGDPVRLEQVLSNLMSNALKYTPVGGPIEVRVLDEGGEVVIRVKDGGVGIDPEMLPRVFELFAQAEVTLARSRGGLGLGLALVRSLVQLHGGQVVAKSGGRDQGSEFEVRLPRVSAPLHLVAEEPASRGAARPLRVVIIEDNDDGRETLQVLLELAGHEVRSAADGVSGCELILSTRPDVALVDIGLPERDGYDVARQVCASAGDERPVLVAMTGYGQPEDKRKAHEAGFDAHLVKPIDPAALQKRLADLGAATERTVREARTAKRNT